MSLEMAHYQERMLERMLATEDGKEIPLLSGTWLQPLHAASPAERPKGRTLPGLTAYSTAATSVAYSSGKFIAHQQRLAATQHSMRLAWAVFGDSAEHIFSSGRLAAMPEACLPLLRWRQVQALPAQEDQQGASQAHLHRQHDQGSHHPHGRPGVHGARCVRLGRRSHFAKHFMVRMRSVPHMITAAVAPTMQDRAGPSRKCFRPRVGTMKPF